jgi:hypothetical protein
MNLKDKVVELVQLGFNEMDKYISSLSEEERNQDSAPDGWSIKDNIAHMHAWFGVLAGRLAGKPDEELRPEFEDFNETNAWFYEQYKDITWEQLLADLGEAEREVLTQIEAQDEDAFSATDRFEWQRERPLWQAIMGTTLDHISLHLANLYNERGDKTKGLQVIQTSTEAVMPLVEDNPDARGVYIYNLGCYYALAGDKERAISHVKQSLPLRPSLAEWSQQDSDLDSLRDEPEFQALFVEE